MALKILLPYKNMVSNLDEKDDLEDNLWFHLNSFEKIDFILHGSLWGHFHFSFKSMLLIKTNILRANAERIEQSTMRKYL